MALTGRPPRLFATCLFATGLFLLVLQPQASASARSFECPVQQKLQDPGALRESASRIHQLSGLLASGDLGNRVPSIIASLRQRHPGVGDAEIENYMVTAYCPVVARLTGLSGAEKQARVSRFLSQVSLAVNRG